MKLSPLVGLLCAASHVQAKAVFAHFMLANAANFTEDTWADDIKIAQEAHIDAFALNIGYGLHNYLDLLNDAFTVAHRLNFSMFLSFDMGQDPKWPANEIVHAIDNYVTGSAYYRHRGDQPLVSTFEGGQNAELWHTVRRNTQTEFFFLPDWSSLGFKAAAAVPVIDGLMSWTAWPAGAHSMNTSMDDDYVKALKDRPYIMPVSPWFYTNLPKFKKNWAWRGDELWYDRWQQVLEIDPEYVEIITWNDYGESHYIGPMHEDDLGIFSIGNAPFNYAEDMPHDGWRAFLPYIIDLYKSGGKETSIENEGLVAWYRVNPGSACESGNTTAGHEWEKNTSSPEAIFQDHIFYTALLESPAEVTVTIGGKDKKGSWVETPDGEEGMYYGSVPFDSKTGDVVITLARIDEPIAEIQGKSITTDCKANKGFNNWNAWVGSAMAVEEKKPPSSGNSSDSSSKTSDSPSRSRPTITLLLGMVLWAWL